MLICRFPQNPIFQSFSLTPIHSPPHLPNTQSPTKFEDTSKSFMFKDVFMESPSSSSSEKSKNQASFYDEIVPQLVRRTLNSQNSTLITLGPPKSGKSYTFHSAHNEASNDEEKDDSSSGSKNDCYSRTIKVNSDDVVKSKGAGLFPKFVGDIFQAAKMVRCCDLKYTTTLQQQQQQLTHTHHFR